MKQSGIHILIIKSILDYAEKKWGKTAKATILKLSEINVEELESLQSYLSKEYFFMVLDIIIKDFNEKDLISDIGSFCAKSVVNESVYMHPILSEGNPISFLKKSTSVLNTFFLGFDITIDQIKGNSFYLVIPEYREEIIYPFIRGFTTEIISNFSKAGRLKLRFKNKENSKYYYKLKYINNARKVENFFFYSSILLAMAVIFFILFFLKTDIKYLIIITFLSYFALIYPFNLFVTTKKAKYYRTLIKELNLHEKKFLELDQIYSLEVSKLKASINQLMELGRSILSENETEEIVKRLTYDAMLLLGSEGAIISFYDAERHQFFVKQSDGKEVRFFADESIIGKIAKLKEAIIINDAYMNPFFNKSLDKELGITTRNLIVSPILDNNNQLIGVMEVYNKIESNLYTDIDLSILVTICNYGSLALQKNILMNKKIVEEQDRIMSKVSDYFSTKSFVNLINNINIPDFEEKKSIIDKLKFFLFIFSKKLTIKLPLEKLEKIENEILKLENVKLFFITDKDKFNNLDIIYNALLVLLKNSKKASFSKNLDLKIEIYFTDEVSLPVDIRRKYGLNSAISEWNNRTENIAENFFSFLKSSYPLLEDDLLIIQKEIQYRKKIIYIDFCGGIQEDIKDKIFYPFFSTYEDHYGIGLNYLQKLLTNNGGQIYFKNNKNIGIEVTMLFD